MTTTEKILSVFLLILLVITIVLGYQKYNLDLEIGVNEYRLNELHEAQIELYDNHIVGLTEKISTLQSEKKALQLEKKKIHREFVVQVDSIRDLPFTGKRVFFSREISRTDSIRERYTNSN
jgi:hypothetical protein